MGVCAIFMHANINSIKIRAEVVMETTKDAIIH